MRAFNRSRCLCSPLQVVFQGLSELEGLEDEEVGGALWCTG